MPAGSVVSKGWDFPRPQGPIFNPHGAQIAPRPQPSQVTMLQPAQQYKPQQTGTSFLPGTDPRTIALNSGQPAPARQPVSGPAASPVASSGIGGGIAAPGAAPAAEKAAPEKAAMQGFEEAMQEAFPTFLASGASMLNPRLGTRTPPALMGLRQAMVRY